MILSSLNSIHKKHSINCYYFASIQTLLSR